jgi:hypothetical protein
VAGFLYLTTLLLKTEPTHMIKKILRAIGIFFLLIIILAIFLPTPPEQEAGETKTVTTLPTDETLMTEPEMTPVAEVQEATSAVSDSQEEIVSPKVVYSIVYEKQNYRHDNAPAYWVLIDPINVATDNFKKYVEEVLRKIIAEKGEKISASIFDDRSMLDLDYKQYGDLSLGRVRTAEEDVEMSRHLVAVFSGQYELNAMYKNEIMWFPGAFKSTLEVGKYVGTIELN